MLLRYQTETKLIEPETPKNLNHNCDQKIVTKTKKMFAFTKFESFSTQKQIFPN